jgi:hypothetical protein
MATPENKQLARHTASAFGGKPEVRAYHHDHVKLSVDILSCVDRPSEGLTSFATLGLSDHPMADREGKEFPVRIELVGACASGAKLFPNIIASAAFHVMRNRQFFGPGVALPGYVAEYYKDTTVPHLYLSAPFLWEETLRTLELPTKKVTWLLIVPISDDEARYLATSGDEAFEDLLQRHDVDIFDLARPSVA